MKNKTKISGPIYDAKQLGGGRMFVLGVQHLFAMFGATVLVPVLTGLSVSSTLLFAGLGTLLFHLITGGKVPAFLGSSFAFLGGYFAVDVWAKSAGITDSASLLPYACLGVACSAFLYFILSALFKCFGAHRVMKFFPPIVTGPIIIGIGLILAPSAINNCSASGDNPGLSWLVAVVAIVIIIVCNIFGKGMIKIIPIILGVIGSYIVAVCFGMVDFTAVKEAAWIGLPVHYNETVFSIFTGGNTDWSLVVTSIITIVPIALATMVEHIGDISAISSTVGKNYIAAPGLHRTLLGDGLATFIASLFGAPANTTYGENTGVLNLTKVFDARVIRIAAYLAVLLSFSPKFAAVISSMPAATIGGVSLVLYGMISAVGVRNIVENNVDFKKPRNVLIMALILVLALGINFSDAGAIAFSIGQINISLSGLAVGALAGIFLNAVLPGKDYKFTTDEELGDKEIKKDSEVISKKETAEV